MYAGNLLDLVNKSLENKIVKASSEELESTQLEYKSLKSDYLPSLFIGTDLAKVSDETIGVPDRSMNSYAQLNYKIYDGGKKQHSYAGFDAQIKGQEYDIDGLKNRISLDVIAYYYQYLSLDAQKRAKEQEIIQLQEQYRKKKKLFIAQTVAIDEVEKILSRLENEKVNLHEIDLQMETVLYTLEYTIGEKVSVQRGSTIVKYTNKDAKLLSELQALEYKMQRTLANARSNKSSIYPQVNLNNKFTHYNENYDGNSNEVDSNLDTQNVISLNLSWKLYDFDATNKKFEADYKKYLAKKSEYEYEKMKVDTQLRLAYRAYDISKLKILSSRSSLKAARATFKAIESKFENFIIDNVAYLEALSELSQAISLVRKSEFDLEIKRANIIYLSGENLVDFIN